LRSPADGVVIAFICLGLVCAPLYAFLLKRENRRKERELAMPEGERRVYTVTELRDLGDRYVVPLSCFSWTWRDSRVSGERADGKREEA
jgi:hypothetical protein